jgi:hypothetical protein
MAEVKFKSGWFCDRLAIACHLPDNAAVAGNRLVDVIAAKSALAIDYVEPGKRGRNRGLVGSWERRLFLNGPKGTPGRITVRCVEVGNGPESSGLVEFEWNPMAAAVDATVSIGEVLREFGCDVSAASVRRCDATLDLQGRADAYVVDDRLRKWNVYGAEHRETQIVGADGPLRVELYDKSTQMREVFGRELSDDVTRLELRVRPPATVMGLDVASGQRVRVPEDRSLASLAAWPYPAPRTSLRRVDPEGVSDLTMRGWIETAAIIGPRACLAKLKRLAGKAFMRDFVESMPRVNVESLWPSSWPSAAGLLVAALCGDCVYGANCVVERVCA